MVGSMNEPRQGTEPLRRQWRAMAAAEPGTLLFETNGQHEPGPSYLFHHPIAIYEPWHPHELKAMFAGLAEAIAMGRSVAGLLRYEAGYSFQDLRQETPPTQPLAWFGVFAAVECAVLPPQPIDTPAASLPLCLEMETDFAGYAARVKAVLHALEAGETYQVNLTTALRASCAEDPLRLYEALSAQQPTPYSALLHLAKEEFVLSFSPELFFRQTSAGRITVKPMKGTAPLQQGSSAVEQQTQWLANDEKNRAEHIMIVDLLRNDLGRICETGSVQVERLFTIEHLLSLLQMTSTISGQLPPATPLERVFQALFPSGSMTGAPKRRTMQIIAALEPQPRGSYSGAIGFALPDRSAVFNVAIRTVALSAGELRMGVGGGIVADSTAEAEWEECWLKAHFLNQAASPFRLVETLLWDGNYRWLEDHLDRLAISADRLHFPLDRQAARQRLLRFGSDLPGPRRVRLLLSANGERSLEQTPFEGWPQPLHLLLSPQRQWSNDTFLRHKTTSRKVYDTEFQRARAAGFGEILFANERDELTEGAISSVLLRRHGRWLTPTLASGVLPGVARSRLLQHGLIEEAVLTFADLHRAEALCVCNAIRGLSGVRSLTLETGSTLHFAETELPQL